MKEYLKFAFAKLAEIDPAVPWAVIALLIFGAVYVLRKFFPRAWESFAHVGPLANIDPTPIMPILRKVWQSLPGQVLGAVLGAVSSGGDAKAAALGALAGIAASLSHEILKNASFIPYAGRVGKSSKPPLLPLLALFIIGCTSGKPAGVPDIPPCSDARLAAITTACATLIVVDCRAHDTECPTYLSCEDRINKFDRECRK